MTKILIIGGADTGRAPMAAALLRRLLERHSLQWTVGSAGVLGHDDDPAEVEARDAMAHIGIDMSQHRALSVDDNLVANAALLIAVDSGTARVLRARFPDAVSRIYSLGELAGRQRDVPDPFRMQIGAWLTYARELDTLLEAALPRIRELLPAMRMDQSVSIGKQIALREAAKHRSLADRAQVVARLQRLLQVAVDVPEVINWVAARARLETDIAAATVTIGDGDLSLAYAGLLRAALALTSNPPSAGQLTALSDALGRLSGSIGQADLNQLSARLAEWATI